jgi:Mg-chelatase subunit ChlD
VAPPAPPPRAEAPKPAPPPPAPEAPRAKPPAEPPRSTACKPRQPGDEPEVVMIFDASGSMRQPFGSSPSRLDAAKRAAESMIRALPADVDVGLVDFSACGQVRRDKFYPSAQRGALVGEVNGLAPKQGTPLADAIRRAGTVASDSAASVLVIVSDGGDSCGGDPCAMARSVKASKPNVTINVIDLSETPQDRQVLQCIASAGGGRLLSPGDPVDMNRKMREAAGAANCP